MIGSIISAILWFLAGVAVTVVAVFLLIRYCYKEIGGKKEYDKNKDEICDAGMEFLEFLFEDKSDEDTD